MGNLKITVRISHNLNSIYKVAFKIKCIQSQVQIGQTEIHPLTWHTGQTEIHVI